MVLSVLFSIWRTRSQVTPKGAAELLKRFSLTAMGPMPNLSP
jgi:hypothetical protein